MRTLLGDAEELNSRVEQIVRRLDLIELQSNVDSLEKEATEPGFWDNPEHAQSKMRKLAAVRGELETWTSLSSDVTSTVELFALAVEEGDDALGTQLAADLKKHSKSVQTLEFELQLSGEYDSRSAILYVKQGAGGVDAQDWAEMLVRMYTRWAERRGFEADVLDLTPGDEAGIKSATIKIDGNFAYGYLRSERGVHRLVRLSPFDADHRRHTSFALVEVLPEADETEEIKINPDDLRIDVFRASGNGGQNVQKNSTAIRLTHLPTNLVVAVQNERSQAQNREVAMRILLSRLVDLDMQKKAEERAALKGEHVSAEFGRQVRSYVQHPYQMVKDHRTDYQTGDAQAVLDGDLDDLLKSYLSSQMESASSSTESDS
ncbi:MAG TPA: peptide chain release factor 2 [Dehalococcoidia bacterium]|nr:peptide chain release factor 2 [Chloroflexota bacterium]MDP6056818.1 peptide chain release factor 2 [Dehalococcoidia bacterium]MDP7089896.1 peptide chain release factor 2 [Dehalococcoidia bacterium]MDP7261528.1 peptide chain release factor 2 [Dehalococcoidia bacterium]MDP7486038.1 peptide chain release factor 2 [Dehalococcoidia bacterium]